MMKCDICKQEKRIRHIIRFKGKYWCTSCLQKRPTNRIQASATENLASKARLTLEEALARTYEVKGYLNRKGHIHTQLQPPQILIGHKIKLVLVDDTSQNKCKV